MFKVLSFNKLHNKFIRKLFRHFYGSTVIKVAEEEYNGYVYNLSIEDDETFFCDGVLVHNCRSTTVPAIRDEFSARRKVTGERPAIGSEGATQVSAKSTYGGWLRKQPKEFIDEALGVERSKLFRSGKISIDKFVDPTGRAYTLEQLRSMNQIALNEL